jgi:hypothetical protein
MSKDTVVTITPTQLKTANLIFAEHKMLVAKVPLLESKISNLTAINANWIKVDSLRSSQISLYQETIKRQEADVTQLKKSLKKTKLITGGSVLATIILAVICVFK